MKIRKGWGRLNSGGIQGSYEPSVELKGFWEQKDKRKFSSPYARKKTS
jgi:hypothetical protein